MFSFINALLCIASSILTTKFTHLFNPAKRGFVVITNPIKGLTVIHLDPVGDAVTWRRGAGTTLSRCNRIVWPWGKLRKAENGKEDQPGQTR
jgi:hypothetical protein